MRYLTPIPKQFVDQSGIPYSDGTVSVYLSGSDELADIFEDAEGDALCPNPCKLDSNGAWQCFVPGGIPLDYIVQDKHGNVVFPYYNIVPASGDGSGTPVSVDGTVGEIDVNENTEGGVKHFVVGLATTIKNAITALQLAVKSIGLSLNGKKDKQTPVNESGSTTKTLVGITQDTNGVIYPHFDYIDYSPSNDNITDEYDSSKPYPIIGTLVIHNNKLYRNVVSITSPELWDSLHWEESTISKELYSGGWIDLPASWWIGPNTRYFFLKANRKSKIIYIDIATEKDSFTPEDLAPGAQKVWGPLLEIPSEVQAMHAVGNSMIYRNNSLDLVSFGGWYFATSSMKLSVQFVNYSSSYVDVSSCAISGIIPYSGEI